LIIELLRYLAFLRPKLCVTLDFSLLQAVVSWIQEALRSAPVHFPGITQPWALLSQTVAPTSGLGLTDIWSSWRGSVDIYSRSAELGQVISGADADDNEDRYSESHIYWGSETPPHLLEPLATGRFARVTLSTDLSSEHALISAGQVGVLCSSTPLWMNLPIRQHACQRPASINETLRINKTLVTKELAILAHMHDGEILPVCSSSQLVRTTFPLNEM
jgi:hypothetical protein